MAQLDCFAGVHGVTLLFAILFAIIQFKTILITILHTKDNTYCNTLQHLLECILIKEFKWNSYPRNRTSSSRQPSVSEQN